MEHYNMNLTLKIWRQKNSTDKGGFETYQVSDISSEMSFLEMLDVVNQELIEKGDEPIAFDHDCVGTTTAISARYPSLQFSDATIRRQPFPGPAWRPHGP